MSLFNSITSKIKIARLAISIVLLLNFVNCFSQDKTQVNHAFHDAFVFGVDGGFTISQTDYEKGKAGYSVRAVGEYFFKTNSPHLFGLKLKLGTDELTGEDSRTVISSQDGPREIPPIFKTSIFSAGLAATYSVSVADVFFPYLSVGITNLWFDPKDDAGNPAEGNTSGLYSKSAIAYSLELGFKVLVSDQFSINLSGNPYFPQTDYLDDVAGAFENDAYSSVMVGFSYSPFLNTDYDNDGISGSDDYCPEKPEDFDGFEDEDGCPDYDNDNDGILDINDKCPNDAEDLDGFQDKDGCPDLDNDGDGIEDALDKCPNEAEVINGIDDEDGCPDEILQSSENRIILFADDIFQPNSYKIMFEAKDALDKVMKEIQASPIKKWKIEGHMDSEGETRFLRTLSLERAKAILEYFTYFGDFKREDFQVFGMGDNSPVGDNNTEEGRRLNRRIEIIGIE